MAPKVAPKRRSAWLANALQRAEARRSSSAAKPRPQKYLQGVDVVALRAHVAAAAVAEAAAAADAGPSTMHDLPQPPPSAGAPRKPPARGVATHRLAVAADSWTDFWEFPCADGTVPSDAPPLAPAVEASEAFAAEGQEQQSLDDLLALLGPHAQASSSVSSGTNVSSSTAAEGHKGTAVVYSGLTEEPMPQQQQHHHHQQQQQADGLLPAAATSNLTAPHNGQPSPMALLSAASHQPPAPTAGTGEHHHSLDVNRHYTHLGHTQAPHWTWQRAMLPDAAATAAAVSVLHAAEVNRHYLGHPQALHWAVSRAALPELAGRAPAAPISRQGLTGTACAAADGPAALEGAASAVQGSSLAALAVHPPAPSATAAEFQVLPARDQEPAAACIQQTSAADRAVTSGTTASTQQLEPLPLMNTPPASSSSSGGSSDGSSVDRALGGGADTVTLAAWADALAATDWVSCIAQDLAADGAESRWGGLDGRAAAC